MAYLIHDYNNNVQFIAKTEANARSLFSVYDDWKVKGLVKTLTDVEFNSLNNAEKRVQSISADGCVLVDRTTMCLSKEDMDGYIESQILRIKEVLKIGNFTNNTTFKTELENFITTLESVDTSNITYPIISLEKYLIDNNIDLNPIGALQY